MTSNAFMPNTDSGKADLLDHAASILPRYAALLEVSIKSHKWCTTFPEALDEAITNNLKSK